MNYTVLLHKKSFLKADGYFQDLLFDKKKPGGRIAELLDEKDVELTSVRLREHLEKRFIRNQGTNPTS